MHVQEPLVKNETQIMDHTILAKRADLFFFQKEKTKFLIYITKFVFLGGLRLIVLIVSCFLARFSINHKTVEQEGNICERNSRQWVRRRESQAL